MSTARPSPAPAADAPQPARLGIAISLALAAAVSLGLARFSYALLLPPMRADLGWSYFTAGAMNTVNAAGYLAGALLLPRALARWDARHVLLAGGAGAALALALHGLVAGDGLLFMLRFLTGLASAATFVAGGLLAARLAQRATRPGLVLGLYYGGTGLGIVLSALVVPPLAGGAAAHAWQHAWLALGALAALCTAITAATTGTLAAHPSAAGGGQRVRWAAFGWLLAGYLMFGLGYIGYMTFVVTLLREQGLAPRLIVAFYVLLGLGVVASSWLWAGLLQRWRGGQPLALLNGLLAAATLLPVVSAHPVAVFASGALFGAVFLSVVAATTAFVRHNLPPAAWPAGISAFTIVFAAGQIVGPSITGWVADGPGGLARGFVLSAAALALGAGLALKQRPLG
ncbi:YbfB/YjiJ family MFS transporter [Aquincola sp. J276]|uniref:YbfB/YjiJ family MFS transporter n=1 Tax=Aquincola sp. J276 TaxID=2898432 RepID=UPI002151A1E4|nr:YbfB/YjiJ family MFS transporter [Aquincola sp. J276]MCR5866497.1 YbfB/YjiJ family MFS transporter [Aquincola sp. J276]